MSASRDPFGDPGSWHIAWLHLVTLLGALSIAALLGPRPHPFGGLLVALVVAGAVLALTPALRVGRAGLTRTTALGIALRPLAPRLAAAFERHHAFDRVTGLSFVTKRDPQDGSLLGRFARLERDDGPAIDVDVSALGLSHEADATVLACFDDFRASRRVLVATRATGAAHCPFCRAVVDGEAARACASCAVVHHAECLDAHGGCATHGCVAGPRRIERRRLGVAGP